MLSLALFFVSRGNLRINTTKTLFCARSIIENGSVIWTPIENTHIDRIESVQKRFLLYCNEPVGLLFCLVNKRNEMKSVFAEISCSALRIYLCV